LFTKLGAIKVAQFSNPCQEGKQFRKTKAQPRVEQNVSETRKLESGPQSRAFIIPPRTVQVFYVLARPQQKPETQISR
jgi:hypothetical protein